ncbi:uncharacterized protein wu:fc21g02 [Lampris incognitus]|uniref:uncharacterized protein wu:fc21g02 n=1 Tax=Lampris incognitus TaxID=2546036 RepID=UPI0024B5A6C9|nr:uncharacterized protein wu:fc21g02 [Lampris incognitus]
MENGKLDSIFRNTRYVLLRDTAQSNWSTLRMDQRTKDYFFKHNKDHQLAHWALAPVRLNHWLSSLLFPGQQQQQQPQAESYAVNDFYERLSHGRQLKIYLPKSAETLEFTPANDPAHTHLYWEKRTHRVTRGRVSGTGNDRRWSIDKVTIGDEGTYTQRDLWKNEISTVKVVVTWETLYISLEGLELADAVLSFSGEGGNFTLVQDGVPVSQHLQEYWNRVKVQYSNIEIMNVNTSDVGQYTLTNHKYRRVVSVTRMDLTDHHDDSKGNPLLALLLLLGIPAGICCCCRKKIFKQKASTTATLQSTPETVHPPPAGPMGPPPAYYTPGQPGAAYYHDSNMGPAVYPPPNPAGPPAAPFNPAYNPQDPAYPPVCPAVVPPAQPPQWSGPPPGQYGPGPGAPVNYAPAPEMYGAPPPASTQPIMEEVKMENMAPQPTDHLLTTPMQAADPSSPTPPFSSNGLNPADAAYQFQIDSGKSSSTNFL